MGFTIHSCHRMITTKNSEDNVSCGVTSTLHLGHHTVLRAYVYSYISWLTSVTIVPSIPAWLDSSMRRTSSKEPLLIACCRSAGPLNTRITIKSHFSFTHNKLCIARFNGHSGPIYYLSDIFTTWVPAIPVATHAGIREWYIACFHEFWLALMMIFHK